MKTIAEYLERALEFERMAAAAENPRLKGDLQKLAASYRRLAEELATQKLPDPPPN